MSVYKRMEGESEKGFIYRICEMKDLIGTWYDVRDILNAELGHDWNESAYRKQYQSGARYLAENQKSIFEGQEYLNKIRKERETLQRERYKLQTEKLEYNRWLREQARDELFEEKILQAITENVGMARPPQIIPITRNSRCAVLCISDTHYGKDVQVKGVYGDTINLYNPEIFEERMEKLLSETIHYCQKEDIRLLKIFNLGDSVDGLLRSSQIWNLRWGVIDSAIKYGDYMAKWLYELSTYVGVEYYPVAISNHAEIRMLDGKKDQHLNESAEKIITKIIEVTNQENPNMAVITNETGFIFTDAAGFNLFGIHGEFKNADSIISEYQELYGANIDYMIHGHKHTMSNKETAVKKGVIGVGSLCGIDDLSVKIRKASDATASLLIFEENKGKTDEHIFVLS